LLQPSADLRNNTIEVAQEFPVGEAQETNPHLLQRTLAPHIGFMTAYVAASV
jgi:hypothetical protein